MCGRAATCTKSTATRGVYVFQFILVAVTAYLFSNWAYKWLEKVPGNNLSIIVYPSIYNDNVVLAQCTLEDNTSCYGALSVYRICFGLTESTISFGSNCKFFDTTVISHFHGSVFNWCTE